MRIMVRIGIQKVDKSENARFDFLWCTGEYYTGHNGACPTNPRITSSLLNVFSRSQLTRHCQPKLTGRARIVKEKRKLFRDPLHTSQTVTRLYSLTRLIPKGTRHLSVTRVQEY